MFEQEKNYGVAKALNQIFEYANKSGAKWVLTLDQDSVVPENMMMEYEKYIDYSNIGIIGCQIQDRNIDTEIPVENKADIVNSLITSGSLTNVKIWREIGGFDEKLFIDFVDKDFCIRLIQHGFILLKINAVKMKHAIGKTKMIKLFLLSIKIYNHPPVRKYYQMRNMIYLNQKYKRKLSISLYFHIFIMFIKIILFEKQKEEKIQELIRGLIDGHKMRLNKIE